MEPANILYITPIDRERWTMSLEIETGRGGAFCMDLEGSRVTEYQPVY